MKILQNKTLLMLGLVSFFADISSEMLYPITPLFMTTVLGASMLNVGFIEGMAEFISSLVKLYSGQLSDRWQNRKFFVLLGYFLAAVSKPLIGLSTLWPQVLGARALDRVGKGIRGGPRDAWLSDSVPQEQWGEAFGWHRGMDNLGAFLGPLLALALITWAAVEIRSMYFWAVIPGLLAVVCVALAPEVRARTSAKSLKKAEIDTKKTFQMSHDFKKYLVIWGVFSLANSSDAFLILKAKNAGLSITITILLYCLFNLVSSILSPRVGKISDQFPKKKILIFGFCVYAIVYMGFAAASDLWQFIILFALYGFYTASTDGVGKAFAVQLLPKEHKAQGLGTLGMITGICSLGASLLAGLLWDQLGSSWCFFVAGAGALFAAALLTIIQLQKSTNDNAKT